METSDIENVDVPVENAVQAEDKEVRRRRRHPFQTMLLVDVMRDPDSRPAFLWALGAILIGMLAYHLLEGWSFLDSFYFCVITLATVGYGDLTPTTPLAKIFTVIYIINGIAILLALFDRIRVVRSAHAQENRQNRKENPRK